MNGEFIKDEYIRAWKLKSKHTRQDVADVLTGIGKPGGKRELKREVIAEVFPKESRHGRSKHGGLTTLDDIENYPEY